jgi:hypothetical protein
MVFADGRLYQFFKVIKMDSQVKIRPNISQVCLVRKGSPELWAENRRLAIPFQTYIRSSLSTHLCVERQLDLLTAAQVTFLTISEHCRHNGCKSISSCLTCQTYPGCVQCSEFYRLNLRVYAISGCLWIGFWGGYVDLRWWRYQRSGVNNTMRCFVISPH